MTFQPSQMVKNNVRQFDHDVLARGSYVYTSEALSARTANERISRSVAEAFDFRGKAVLDVGCGDGAYTTEFPALGTRKVVGIDPASVAIEAAKARAKRMGLGKTASFLVGNIYELDAVLAEETFDCVVLRGVLHHLPDPERAIAALASYKGAIVIIEPNGYNPMLKLLERFSEYHVQHEEQSFTPLLIRKWLRRAGFDELETTMVNLVPFFCPDWMVPPLQTLGGIVEHLPLVRSLACGQSVIVARKRSR